MSSTAVQRGPIPSEAQHSRIVAALIYCYPIILLMVLWELLAHSGLISPLLWPSLEKIALALWKFAVSGDLMFHGLITLQRALSGFVAALVVGVLIGTMLGRSRILNRLFEPIFVFGYPVPKISLYPVFIFVFGLGDMSKIVLIFLECLYRSRCRPCSGCAAPSGRWCGPRKCRRVAKPTVLAGAGALGRARDLRRHPHRTADFTDRRDHHRNHRRKPRPRLCGRVCLRFVRTGARNGGVCRHRGDRLRVRPGLRRAAPAPDLLAARQRRVAMRQNNSQWRWSKQC